MSRSAFLEAFLAKSPPKNIRLAVARGAAPLPPQEMLLLLSHLGRDPEEEVAAQAAATLEQWNAEEILVQLGSRDCPPAILEYFSHTSRAEFAEAVILNPATPGPVIEEMAMRVTGALLEAVLYNRVRLLEFPAIVQNAKQNPDATPEVQRLIREIEQEFFSDKKLDYSVSTETEAEAPLTQAEGLESELPPDDLWLEGLPSDPEAREGVLSERLARMSVRDKVKAAMLGPREARSILIRDTNRQISQAVLESPKLTDSEVESFAAMRNVSEDILRSIGVSRQWVKSYSVAVNLVKNPKTPPMVSQTLISRLQTRDLQTVARDRGVSELVRRNAQRVLNQRMGGKKQG
jgi:hypothetical protein